MTGPVVGLIDSGIGGAAAAHVTAHRSFTLAAAGYVTTGGDSDTADPAGHGSALADILLCRGDAAALYDARVFDSRMRCSAAQLAAALDWLRASHEVRLVNLSVGLRRDRPVLRRETPYHPAHSTDVAGLRNIQGGDNRFYNNIFVGHNGLTPYDETTFPVRMAGNVFLNGAAPSEHEKDPLVLPEFDPGLMLAEVEDGLELHARFDPDWTKQPARPHVTTDLLGNARIPDLPYVQPDGAPYRIDRDYFGRRRSHASPFPGPFAKGEAAKQVWKVWPVGPAQHGAR